MLDKPTFSLSVASGFDEDGVWVIDVRLRWAGGVAPPIGSNLLGEARLMMLRAIAQEAKDGRARGATKVRVHMEGHEAGEMETLGDPES